MKTSESSRRKASSPKNQKSGNKTTGPNSGTNKDRKQPKDNIPEENKEMMGSGKRQDDIRDTHMMQTSNAITCSRQPSGTTTRLWA